MAALVPELYCSDFQTSLEFYVGILGFYVLYDRPDEGFAYLKKGDAEIMIDQVGKTRTWLKADLEHPFGRGVNLQINMTDINKFYASVLKSGSEIFMPIEDKTYQCGHEEKTSRQFIVCDPDGYLLRFFEDIGDTQ